MVEQYCPDHIREDRALYNTLVAIRNRLNYDLEIDHPTVPDEKLTRGPDDTGTRFLREKLSEAIDQPDVLFDPDCTRKEALKAWYSVFYTTYFSDREADERSQAAEKVTTSASLIGIANQPEPTAAVRKHGGGQYA